MEIIKFEVWKNKKQIVIRNDKGQLISRTPQKGSGIKTKEEAYKIYQRTNTLNPNSARVSIKSTEFENDNINKITIKGSNKSKTLNVKRAGFKKAKQIGRNTAIIITSKPIASEKYKQIVVKVKWGDKEVETTGYSDINGTLEQAFKRAMSGAINKGLLQGSGYKVQFIDDNSGLVSKVISQNSKDLVYFKYEKSYQTYVNTENKTFESLKVKAV